MADDLYDRALAEARALYALSEAEAVEGADRVELALQAGVTGALAALRPDAK